MKTSYLQVLISAENTKQADKILSSLLKKKLVIGGLMIKAPAKFWWKGKIIKMDYCNISTFTILKHKKAIIGDVRKNSVEEVPMILFSPIEGNKEFCGWLLENLA